MRALKMSLLCCVSVDNFRHGNAMEYRTVLIVSHASRYQMRVCVSYRERSPATHRCVDCYRNVYVTTVAAFCAVREAGIYAHPLHCWQFVTSGKPFGGSHEMSCYSGRRFVATISTCMKDRTCIFGTWGVF